MDKVYISFKKNSQVTDRKVTVGDVASVWCADPKLLSVVKSHIILKIPETKKYREVVSALKVISIIGDNVKNADINNLGETEFIVSYQEKSEDSKTIFSKLIFKFPGSLCSMPPFICMSLILLFIFSKQ